MFFDSQIEISRRDKVNQVITREDCRVVVVGLFKSLRLNVKSDVSVKV